MEEKEVLNELIENLYFSINTFGGVFRVDDKAKLARAYKIAEQLYEYGLVDEVEVEDFVNRVTEVTA